MKLITVHIEDNLALIKTRQKYCFEILPQTISNLKRLCPGRDFSNEVLIRRRKALFSDKHSVTKVPHFVNLRSHLLRNGGTSAVSLTTYEI
ncbi:hypothetical protein CEXT_164131 [Caerostris extrusa]|uniref:Uncharacterized protein n=1 Tax=Caerostris extrusa TaxID=172846 RepID=A0AAV4P8E2_CAEEX|nr:hypothetical protein CEXT_164131 [Caerostris extrusa]